MSDRSTFESFDAFERRLATELERYVAAAVDPRSPAEVADGAMVARGVAFRGATTLAGPSRRRILLLGLAAALLVPAVYLGAGAIRRTPVVPVPVAPSPPPVAVVEPSAFPAATPVTATFASPRPTLPAAADAMSIFVRRTTDPVPGVAVYAAGPDGAETLVRTVPDTAVAGGKLSEWGTVSSTGWIALVSEVRPWPMVLVDLRDATAASWVVDQASTGGIGPRWGPTGLVAADAARPDVGGSVGALLVIADPETRETRLVSMRGGLVGGGPSIVWTADGSGIVGSTEAGRYQVVPIDGSDPRQGVREVFDPRGAYGPRLAELRICDTSDAGCGGAADGRVERTEPQVPATTVWTRQGDDRALAAAFGTEAGDYWITTTHANGTQIALVHVTGGSAKLAATINRDAAWQYVGAPVDAPDHSAQVMWLDIGAKPAAVIVPASGSDATYHTGMFAGFVDRAAIAASLGGTDPTPGQRLPGTGEAYRLPSLDTLIAAELGLNPGERVIGKASHDGVGGDTAFRTTTIETEMPGGSVYLDCIGPASVTLTTGAGSTVHPCLAAGSSIIEAGSGAPITVTARGDTSWRVAVYVQGPPDGSGTPPPVSG